GPERNLNEPGSAIEGIHPGPKFETGSFGRELWQVRQRLDRLDRLDGRDRCGDGGLLRRRRSRLTGRGRLRVPRRRCGGLRYGLVLELLDQLPRAVRALVVRDDDLDRNRPALEPLVGEQEAVLDGPILVGSTRKDLGLP